MQSIFAYLKKLKKHNNREWFHKNKDEYDSVKEVFTFMVDQLIAEIKRFDPSIGNPLAKGSLFRIYRDIRFSNDKTPYKTHFAAWIVQGGKKSDYPGYYLHIEPGNSFLAMGIWNPDNQLRRFIRHEIVSDPDELIDITQDKDLQANFHQIEGDKLKRIPTGFPKEFPHPELLKLQDYILSHAVDEKFFDEQWISKAADIFRSAYPFNRYFSSIIDDYKKKSPAS